MEFTIQQVAQEVCAAVHAWVCEAHQQHGVSVAEASERAKKDADVAMQVVIAAHVGK